MAIFNDVINPFPEKYNKFLKKKITKKTVKEFILYIYEEDDNIYIKNICKIYLGTPRILIDDVKPIDNDDWPVDFETCLKLLNNILEKDIDKKIINEVNKQYNKIIPKDFEFHTQDEDWLNDWSDDVKGDDDKDDDDKNHISLLNTLDIIMSKV